MAQELYSEFVPAPVSDAGPHKPVLVSFHDDMTRRLHHLKVFYGFDPKKAELEVLGYNNLAQSLSRCKKPLDPKVSAERAARFHKLLSHCSRQTHISSAGMSFSGFYTHKVFIAVIFFVWYGLQHLSIFCPCVTIEMLL